MSKYEDLKISNELLAEVLENHIDFKDCDSFNFIEILGTQISISYCYPFYDNYGSDGSCDCSFKKSQSYINIYEFAFKCKEWAFNKGKYKLKSQSYEIRNHKSEREAFCYIHLPISGMGMTIWADTEVEAIIKACEWILSQEVKND